MKGLTSTNWEGQTSPPKKLLSYIKPGMSIFLGTGVSEPRTLIKYLLTNTSIKLRDIEFIQLFSLGEAVPLDESRLDEYRLKTFFPGWITEPAISAGYVDVIPCSFMKLSSLMASGEIKIDMALIQISPPDADGNSSFGVSMDVVREAMKHATIVVGEINADVPRTTGNTLVNVSDFHLLVMSKEPLFHVNRSIVDDIYDKIATNVSNVIQNGSCLSFSVGPLFDALSSHLKHKKDIGIHSPVITDAVMDLIKTGVVTNVKKEFSTGKSLTSYALGSQELFKWLNNNQDVVFEKIEKVIAPEVIGQHSNFMALASARKVDLSGRIAFDPIKRDMVSGAGEISDIFRGAQRSRGGCTIVTLPSQNKKGESNIRVSLDTFPGQFCLRELMDVAVTEYGIADLRVRSLRERAQALIDIAHPDDRPNLIEAAKDKKIIYPDQIFYPECAYIDPSNIATTHRFKDLDVRFRAIKPSDEEEMRRLFYRFSRQSIYYRYFYFLGAMPHTKMQEYVNVDCEKVVSIVGLVGDPGRTQIIAEARYNKVPHPSGFAEVAFIVEDKYQNMGIATFLYKMLIHLAKEQGIKGFTADVLTENRKMLGVFEKGGIPVQARFEEGTYSLTIPFHN